jgi:hypothetical protein
LVSSLAALGGKNRICVNRSTKVERGQSIQVQVFIPGANKQQSGVCSRTCGRASPFMKPGTTFLKPGTYGIDTVRGNVSLGQRHLKA